MNMALPLTKLSSQVKSWAKLSVWQSWHLPEPWHQTVLQTEPASNMIMPLDLTNMLYKIASKKGTNSRHQTWSKRQNIIINHGTHTTQMSIPNKLTYACAVKEFSFSEMSDCNVAMNSTLRPSLGFWFQRLAQYSWTTRDVQSTITVHYLQIQQGTNLFHLVDPTQTLWYNITFTSSVISDALFRMLRLLHNCVEEIKKRLFHAATFN